MKPKKIYPKIQFTSGCPNNCEYCYETTEIKTFKPIIPKEPIIQILDMNFLCNKNLFWIFENLPKRKYELICGIDYRILNETIAKALKDHNFIKMRWAWDYDLKDQKIHQKIWKMLLNAGFKANTISVFILTNWKISFKDCCAKLDLLKVWGLKVNDCCFDGGYPKNEFDFITDKRFDNKRHWDYYDLKNFRKMCRKHNQLIVFKIDPEI